MKPYRMLVYSLVLFIALIVVACGSSGDAEGVHGPGGVQGDAQIGLNIQASGESGNVIVIENSGQLATRAYDVAGFDEVEASMFDLDIRPGEMYTVTVEVEKNALPHVRVSVEDGRLKLGLAPDETYNMVNVPLRAQIAMPELAAIVLDLSSTATLTGFDCSGSLAKTLTLGSSLTCDLGAEQVRFEVEF